MSLNAMSAVRIGALLAVAVGCAWGAGQYLDSRTFERRNADAIAMCGAFTPGMAIAEAKGRADAVSGAKVAFAGDNLVVKIPGQSLCFIVIVGGRVRSAAVARNG
jgi:hypothetical protein